MPPRMTSADALQILGLAPGASAGHIRHAYLRLALIWHPDRHTTEPQRLRQAEERFKVIGAAYEHLKGFGPYDGQSPTPCPAPRPSHTTTPRSPHRTPGRPPEPAPLGEALPQTPWWATPVAIPTWFWIGYLLLRVVQGMGHGP